MSPPLSDIDGGLVFRGSVTHDEWLLARGLDGFPYGDVSWSRWAPTSDEVLAIRTLEDHAAAGASTLLPTGQIHARWDNAYRNAVPAGGTGGVRDRDRVRIWCLRHAESEANAGVPGAIDDCGLTQLGRSQAIHAARLLAAEPITRIYSSTALRARQTAELLATALTPTQGTPGTPAPSITPMPELVEVDCTADALRTWVVDRDLSRPAADWTGAETGHQVVARVTAAFQTIAATHPGETVAVVGHVASLTVALERLCALGPGVWGTPLPHARPFLFEWDGCTWHCPHWPALSPVS